MPSSPGSKPIVVGKARHATVLLQRYHQVQNDGEKVQTVALLNELFPDIRFRHEPKAGLTVFYLEDRVLKLPTSVAHSATVILKVRRDGKAEVQKDKLGGLGQVIVATELLAELGGVIPRRSRWDRIGNDEDWL